MMKFLSFLPACVADLSAIGTIAVHPIKVEEKTTRSKKRGKQEGLQRPRYSHFHISAKFLSPRSHKKFVRTRNLLFFCSPLR